MAAQRKSKSRKTNAKTSARGRSKRRDSRARPGRRGPPSRGRAGVRARKKARRPEARKQKGSALIAKAKKLARLRKKRLLEIKKARALAKAKKQSDRAKAQKQREIAERKKAAQRARLDAERKRAQARKALEREQANKRRAREQEAKKRAHERERLRRDKERKDALKAREREAARKKAEKDKARKQRERDQARLQKEREVQKAQQKKAREAEKQRQRAEKAAERIRIRAEREAERERVREEARRKRDEERAKRDAEREAYRKAKEAEQARLRAEKEAARRALDGRVVRATRASRAAQGGRLATTTRVYTPSSIPDQSGTRRAIDSGGDSRFANLRTPAATPRPDDQPIRAIQRTLPPPPPPPPPATIEERYARITERLAKTDEAFRREYEESYLMSWIYHDSALEGVVYTYEELRLAINPNIAVVPDSSLQSVCDEIRRHKAAIEFVKEQAEKKRVPVTIDTLKRIYLILHPEEGDLKTVKYRKDIPQHRLYFHEYAAPDKIAYKVRQVFDWLNGPEPKKIKNSIRVTSRMHYDLVRVFPFATDSGKAVRLLMNLLLMRADCPPAIIHSTERQRYYEALRGQLPVIVAMVTESINNALASIEKKLDERDTKLHTFA